MSANLSRYHQETSAAQLRRNTPAGPGQRAARFVPRSIDHRHRSSLVRKLVAQLEMFPDNGL